MNLLKCVLSVILLLLYMRPNSATDVMSCPATREPNEDCRTYCHKVVKPLLQYFRISAEKNDQYEKQQGKLEQQQATIKRLEAEKEIWKLQATIHEQQLVINKFEYKELLTNYTKQREQTTNVEAQKESLMKSEQLQTKITELQTRHEAQQEGLRKSAKLISEKDKRIVDLDKELEARDEAQKETLKETQQLQAKVNELQTKIEESDKLKDSLISEKDKRIADLKEQIQNMNKNKQFEDKLIKFVDRAEASSCLPFGNSNDIQTIRVTGIEAFKVPCDSKFAGNGWTVIQRRLDGSVSFDRNWEEYKNGFGDLRGNFWLGLEKLHMMTKSQPHELYIQLEDFKKEKRYERYSDFRIGNEAQAYKLLSVGKHTGNAGNALDTGDGHGGDSKNMKFSTPERDNDKADNYNCAAVHASGWWFNRCSWCNPNGDYFNTKTDDPHILSWDTWHNKPLKFMQMMIRPTNN